jgi:hypothetical protein
LEFFAPVQSRGDTRGSKNAHSSGFGHIQEFLGICARGIRRDTQKQGQCLNGDWKSLMFFWYTGQKTIFWKREDSHRETSHRESDGVAIPL